MNADIHDQVPDSSSSNLTAVSLRSEAVLRLGNRIVEEFGPDQSADTLARWMSHYIAELIHIAETENGEKQQATMAACAGAILDLWKHRAHLPNGTRPFERLDPILRAVESLDPNVDASRYFRSEIEMIEKDGDGVETRKWLSFAKGLDYSAKVLISYCLVYASDCALDGSEEWVKLAKAAGVDKGDEFPVIRFVAAEADLLNGETPDDKGRKMIEDRITRLEAIQEMISQVVAHLRERLI